MVSVEWCVNGLGTQEHPEAVSHQLTIQPTH